jgi:Flp pilus assembly protein TadG
MSDRASSGEAGYVLPMMALLLIPLMIFAALATDVGAWYIRADEAQRAADAAALAGTVWLPDQAEATEVALDVAARNGFRDPAWVAVHGGTANATVSVPGVTDTGGLRVDVTTQSPSYFGALVLDSVSIERRSVAAVTRPVRLGNPSNGLGTGNLASSELGIPPDGIWLSLNGWCQDHQQGDPFSVGYFGTAQAGGNYWDACGSARLGPNPTLEPSGYTFVVDVPPGAGQVNVEVFEPGLCTDANGADQLYSAEDAIYSNGPRLNFRVFANDDTELYHDDNLAQAPVANVLYDKTDCTGGSGAGGRWYTLYSIPAGAANEGRWYVQANVRQNVLEYNLNSFAVRARPSADTQLCTSMLDATCPELYALDWMSLYRPSFGGAFSGQPSEFFLADISDQHAGKSVEVTMFDPGEGMNNVQFLDPSGALADFTFRLANCTAGSMCSNPVIWPDTNDADNDSCSGSPCLNVTNSRFQDQFVVITIDLPANYTCGTNCWWKVRYTPQTNGSVTDRTTWSVRVIGGPVHLIE